jgi:hypothetical protein
MSVEDLENNVAGLAAEELARFTEWFKKFTDEEEWEKRRRAVESVEAFRAEMFKKYGVQPSSVDIIREARESSRA